MAVSFDAPGFLRTETAGADLSAKEGFALVGSSGNAVTAGANVRILGICVDPVVSGRTTTIQVAGLARAVAGAAITKHALLATDSQGRLVTATAGQNVVAQAMEAAGGAGAIISVELFNGGGGLA